MSYIVDTGELPCGHSGVYKRRPDGGVALPSGDGGSPGWHCHVCGAAYDDEAVADADDDGYYWEGDNGAVWRSTISDHTARGTCSGIPACCVAHFVAGGREPLIYGWGYIPCPDCVRTGRCVEVKTCDASCTCGQWATRVLVED